MRLINCSLLVMWDDNSGIYSPSISSYGYGVRGEWLAKRFVQDLIKKQTDYEGEFANALNHEFDELWIRQNDSRSAFIAREKNNVYYVVYDGKERIDKIIDQTLAKIER